MARRKPILRRYGRLVLELPEPTGPIDDPRRRRLRWVRVSLIAFLVGLIFASATTYGFVTAITTNLPDLRQFDGHTTNLAQDGSIWVTGETGTLRRIAILRSDQSRVIVQSDQISKQMKDAVVAIEDKRFYRHNGVDLNGIARALFNRFASGTNEGASTITQQLVKNTYLTAAQTVQRKVREASLAWQLEQRWSKDRILTAYLNTVYFGHNTYGVESAAKYYFGTSAKNLDPADSALLAAVLKSPTTYDPITNPDAALARRNLVLQAMADQGFIDADTAAVEKGRRLLPITRIEPKPLNTRYPYWVQFITEQLVNRFGTAQTFGGGMKVVTTLDVHQQQLAEQALRNQLPGPTEHGPQGAIVAIDPRTGEVLAMAGGKPYSERHQFNVPADAHRQPGSSFKPFVYLAALEKGVRPSTTFRSAKQLFDLGGGQFWYVTNSEDAYGKNLTLPEALALSDNTVFAQLTMLIKPSIIADVAHRLGIISPIDSGQPAIGLGGLFVGVTPLEMAHAYATIANDGQRVGGSILFHTPDSGITDPSMEPISIKRIEFPDGKTIVNTPVAVQAVPKDDALETIQAMKGVIRFGTGVNAGIGRPAIGKTGTTSDFKDAWFVGSTPQRTTATWVGYENPARPMRTQYNGTPVFGGTYPALIWQDYMKNAMRGQPRDDWEAPVGVPSIPVSVDPRTDQRVPPGCKYAQVVVWAQSLAPLDMGPCETDLLSTPDFTASNRRKANSLATGSGLQIRFQYRAAEPGEKPGTVVVQSPAPLTAVQPGSVVTLVIARKIPSVLVPNVVATAKQPSLTEAAIARLQAAQFRVVVMDQQDAEGLPLGSVVSQSPAPGKPAPLGSVITISSSGDYTGSVVPNVAGMSVADARAELDKVGLVAGAINADGGLNPDDKVFSIEPSPGAKVPRGTKITLYVSPF
ncbi:MAG: transglycosylase domain-containing protein [Gaiellales bacterium]